MNNKVAVLDNEGILCGLFASVQKAEKFVRQLRRWLKKSRHEYHMYWLDDKESLVDLMRDNVRHGMTVFNPVE